MDIIEIKPDPATANPILRKWVQFHVGVIPSELSVFIPRNNTLSQSVACPGFILAGAQNERGINIYVIILIDNRGREPNLTFVHLSVSTFLAPYLH